MSRKIRLALIGLGHWGPNLFRNFYEHPNVYVDVVCDTDHERLKKLDRFGIETTINYQDVLDRDTDAVVIATPVSTHYSIAKSALAKRKHVFVEKPLATSSSECAELIALAGAGRVRLMVGHVFLYNPGIRRIHEMIHSGELGEILFIHAQRTNLGPVRDDVNVFWDLASHDISIFNYWLNQCPKQVSAIGSSVLNESEEDIVSANLTYGNSVNCQILASWIHPRKVRQITVVADRKMVIWDDMVPSEMIRIYDSSIKSRKPLEQVEGTYAEFKFSITEGDIFIPRVQQYQPLKSECDHFIECLISDKQPLTHGEVGADVVRVLEAADKSIASGGNAVLLSS